MKEVRVVSWDDIHKREGRDIEATRIDVPVRFGEIELTVDLTEEHYQAVHQSLAAVLGAAIMRDAREAAVQARLPGADGKKKQQTIPPLEKLCPYPPNTPERSRYLEALRRWADQVGRGDEYQGKPGSTKRAKHMYHYPKDLLLGFNAYLAEQAKAQQHQRAS